MPRLMLGTLCALGLLLVLGGQSPSRSVGDEPATDAADAAQTDTQPLFDDEPTLDSPFESEPTALPPAKETAEGGDDFSAPPRRPFPSSSSLDRYEEEPNPYQSAQPRDDFDAVPVPATTPAGEVTLPDFKPTRANPASALPPRFEAQAAPAVRRNYVVTNRNVTSEKRIELRSGDCFVRITVRGQAAHGAEPETEHATYALEANGQRLTMTTVRNRLTGEVDVKQLDGPAAMQPGTTALLDFIQGQVAHLRSAGQAEEAEFLTPLVAEMRQLRQHQLTELSQKLSAQKATVSDLEAQIAARLGAQPVPPRLSPNRYESSLAVPQMQRISGTRSAQPPRYSDPADGSRPASYSEPRFRSQTPEHADPVNVPEPAVYRAEPADQLSATAIRSLRDEIRELQKTVSELRADVRRLQIPQSFPEGNSSGSVPEDFDSSSPAPSPFTPPKSAPEPSDPEPATPTPFSPFESN